MALIFAKYCCNMAMTILILSRRRSLLLKQEEILGMYLIFMASLNSLADKFIAL